MEKINQAIAELEGQPSNTFNKGKIAGLELALEILSKAAGPGNKSKKAKKEEEPEEPKEPEAPADKKEE